MSESEILRLVVAGIDVECNPDSRIVRQHALNALGHLFRAIGDRDLPDLHVHHDSRKAT